MNHILLESILFGLCVAACVIFAGLWIRERGARREAEDRLDDALAALDSQEGRIMALQERIEKLKSREQLKPLGEPKRWFEG